MKTAQLKPSAIEKAFIANNKKKYRKYSVFGVDKVIGNGAYPLVEFTDNVVYVNRNVCNRADFRNIVMKTPYETKVDLVFVDCDPWKERELHNSKRCDYNSDIVTDFWGSMDNKLY